MSEAVRNSVDSPSHILVAAGADLFGEHRGLGFSSVDIKLSPTGEAGLLVIENILRAKGGPPRHLHTSQEEWFFVLEGEFTMEIGQERFKMRTGDSVLAPRKVPHVWARSGDALGRILIAFTPPGRMEAFFREVLKANAMPPQDPAVWRSYDMELLGPPMPVE